MHMVFVLAHLRHRGAFVSHMHRSFGPLHLSQATFFPTVLFELLRLWLSMLLFRY